MNNIDDVRAQRTDLRLKLYENGYTPLPNKNKACFLEGWSTVAVDPALIQSRGWAKNGKWKDTGIRCGDICAFDFDIDNADLVNRFLDILVIEEILPETPLVRIGRAPREMWIYRVEGDKTAKRTTGGFAPGAQLAEWKRRKEAGEELIPLDKSVVEVLGVGSQFGAFGQHSDEIAYTWPVGNPLDIDISDIPTVNRATIDAVIARATRFFEDEAGLTRMDLAGGTNDGHYSRVYDLMPDMVFTTRELGDVTVAQLEEYFAANPGDMLRCTVEPLRPSTGGSYAGMVNLVQGMLCVSDHGSYSSHYRADGNPAEKLARIGEKLRERFNIDINAPVPSQAERRQANQMADLSMDPRDDFDANLAIAVQRFGFVVNDDTVVDTWANTTPMSTAHFRNMMMPFFMTETGAQGGEKILRVSDAWLQNPDRMNVGTVQMRPDRPWPIYEEDGIMHANTYRPHVLPEGGDAALGLDFIAHLVPDPAERAYFLQWLSYKFQHPEVRGPAIVMVANSTFGTGRGSLAALLTDLFHERYVANVDFNTLTGKNYQSQYNEWLVGSLMVVVNEAADNDKGTSSRWENKNAAYEHLKNIVDPASTRLQVTRKGSSNFQGRTFASVMIMTNHADALVIPAADRRFYIIENGSVQEPEYWDRFHAWRSVPANLGAFAQALKAVDLSDYNPYRAPPMTRAKAEMVYAGTSELDRAVADVLDRMEGKLVVRDQLYLALESYMAHTAVNFPEEWKRPAEKIFTRLTKLAPGIVDRLRIGDKQHTPRALPGLDPEVLKSADAMLEEVLRNGPTVRALGSVGSNVVPLRSTLKGQSDGANSGTQVG